MNDEEERWNRQNGSSQSLCENVQTSSASRILNFDPATDRRRETADQLWWELSDYCSKNEVMEEEDSLDPSRLIDTCMSRRRGPMEEATGGSMLNQLEKEMADGK